MMRLFVFILLLPLSSFAEEAPEAEYPYPKVQKREPLQVEKPAKVDSQGVFYYDKKSKSKKKSYQGVEQPYKVGPDGSYYYNTDGTKDKMKSFEGIEKPIDRDQSGGYYYSRKKEKKKPKAVNGELPDKVTKDGAYMYSIETKTTNNVLSVRGGVYGPPNVQPKTAGNRDFSAVYGDSAAFVLQAEYDWEVWKGVYLKAGSGIFSANGEGQFSGTRNAGRIPKEKFNFLLFPNTASLSYKFSIWDSQLFVPYVDGGLGYFTFAEIRSDGKKNSFGGAFVATAVGGLMISMNSLASSSTLSNDYNVTDIWFDIQYRQVIGLDARKDFTSSMITGGFALGFH